jgi:hypothetical protein
MTSAWKNSSTLPSKTHQITAYKKPVIGCEEEVCPNCKAKGDDCDCHLCIDTLEDDEEMTPEQIEYINTVQNVASQRQLCWSQYHTIKTKVRQGLIEFFDTLTFEKLYDFLYHAASENEQQLFMKN